MSRRQRRHKHEEHANHESWAIPYGDLVTLLLAFFVVMYGISSVNDGKYRVLSDSLVEAFHGTPRTTEPIQIGSPAAGTGASTQVSVLQQAILDSQPRNLLDNPGPPGGAEDAALAIRRTGERVELALGSLIDEDLLTVKRRGTWIEVEIRADILFPSGSAVLSPAALPVLAQVASSLQALPNPLRVEGHTDNLPIRSVIYPSNWELSAARSASVVHLFTEQGIPPARLAVLAYGDTRPLRSNATADGRNANRRVVIVIVGGEAQRVPSGEGGEQPTPTVAPVTTPGDATATRAPLAAAAPPRGTDSAAPTAVPLARAGKPALAPAM